MRNVRGQVYRDAFTPLGQYELEMDAGLNSIPFQGWIKKRDSVTYLTELYEFIGIQADARNSSVPFSLVSGGALGSGITLLQSGFVQRYFLGQ